MVSMIIVKFSCLIVYQLQITSLRVFCYVWLPRPIAVTGIYRTVYPSEAKTVNARS